MPESPSLHASEELAFIRKVIHDSRRAAAVDATPFIVWSGVAVVGALLEYGLAWGRAPVPRVGVWLALIGAAWIYTVWERGRRRIASPATTLAERTLVALWVGCWIAMTLLGFVGYFAGHLADGGIFGAFAAVLGIGMFVTSLLLGETSIRVLAAAWWFASIAFFFWSGPHALALFALLILMLHVVPGLVLQRRWKRLLGVEPGPR